MLLRFKTKTSQKQLRFILYVNFVDLLKPKSVIRPIYGNVLLLLYGLFLRFAFLFAVLLPVPSQHSSLCLRRNGRNTTEIKTKRSEI